MSKSSKSTQIAIRVLPEEKTVIQQKADDYGYSVSEYVRKRALEDDIQPNGKRLQEIATHMCRLATLTNQIKDSKLRDYFVIEETAIWQLIK